MEPNPTHAPRWRRINAHIDDLVQDASEANRAFMAHCVAQRRNDHQKPGSIYAWTMTAARFDRHTLGKPFRDATPPDYVSFLESLREQLAPRSLRLAATLLKTTWRDINDRDDLPRSLRKALTVSIPKDAPAGEHVSPEDFHLLLDEALRLRGGSQGVPVATTWTALLWVLWDAGLRCSEALGLLVSDVELLPDGRALLHLRADGRTLKTGPRVVPIYDAVPALRGLLSVHPHHLGTKSPLFLAGRQRTESGRLQYDSVQRTLTKIANDTGVNDRRAWTSNLTPHDFRHTCATRKARTGWGEADMRKFFGWLNGSKMAAHYVRLNYDDIARRVAHDAGLAMPTSVSTVPPDLQRLVAELVAQELARR